MTNTSNSQYIIQSKLGEGGMGTVYLAEDTMLERLVAIKELNRSTSNTSEPFGNRFQQEALALAKLNHPNITHLYTFVPQEDTYWMVMEYVQGKTLEEWLNINRKLSPELACSIVVQILEGLHHAHRKGIIHRDLKPANVMISDDGEVKIMDFGIARIKNSQRITQSGKSVGTLEYMSPEQIQGKEGDERTDVYAAGTILFELLSGRPPFRSDTDYALMRAKLEDTPDTSAGLAAAPVAIQKAILKSLERHPEKRFENVLAFKNQLQNAFSHILYREQSLISELLEPAAEQSADQGATRAVTVRKWPQKFSLPSSFSLSNIKFDSKKFASALQLPRSFQLKNIRNLNPRQVKELALANSVWILVGVVLLCGSLILWSAFSDDTTSADNNIPGKANDIAVIGDSAKQKSGGEILDNQFRKPVPVVNSNPVPQEQPKDQPKDPESKKKPGSGSKTKTPEKKPLESTVTHEPEPAPAPEEKKETKPEHTRPVEVPAGREINMILAETISSEETGRDGETVRLYAGEDVQSGGRTIIKKGALIVGKIVDVVPASKRRKAVIGFVAQKVEATNGTMIKLHSERFRLFADNGASAVYKQGQSFSAKLGRGRID